MNPKQALIPLVFGALMVVGCGSGDGNRPQTLQQQRDLMNGHYKPTKEQLAKAMGDVRIPTPGANGAPSMPTPPPGAVPKG